MFAPHLQGLRCLCGFYTGGAEDRLEGCEGVHFKGRGNVLKMNKKARGLGALRGDYGLGAEETW